jgi:diaminopimelate decarboxylase
VRRAAASRDDGADGGDEAFGADGDGDGVVRSGTLGGLDAARLAAEFGTPFYVYDLDVIERTAGRLRAVLPPRFDLAYAVKANPALAVVAHLAALGVGADVASGGELELARRAGIEPAGTVFTGPGKRDEELAAAVDAGLRAITVESPGELARLEAISAVRGRHTPVLLRMAVGVGSPAEEVRLVGDAGAGKFGMDAETLGASARRAARSPHLELLGLHAFGASNVLDAASLAGHAATTMAAARAVAVATGTDLRLIDMGGGLGIPYAAGARPLDVAAFGSALAALDRAWATDPVTRATRVIVEPGRYLVARAGAFVVRVVDRKCSAGSTVVILDGGIHHLLRPALVGQEHRIVTLGPRPAGARRSDAMPGPVTVAGPLCSGLDVLARAQRMVAPEVGELVAVLDVGAYGYTESMPLFLSHPTPAEVAIRGGRSALIRSRVEPSAWLETQRLPGW